MYLKADHKGGHVYWNVVESKTTLKGPRQKIVMHLGKLDDDQVAAIRLRLRATHPNRTHHSSSSHPPCM